MIKNVIGPGELVVIYGAPKSGKTFFSTDLGLSVAAGMEWFGHRVKAGPVVYIASEMGAMVQRRVVAWMQAHTLEAPPFVIIPQVVNLLDDLPVERLIATLKRLQDELKQSVSLTVVDTLARSMSGGDENTAQDMGRAIAVTDRLRDELGTATALVHHAGKDPGRGARGSNALLGAVDAAIYVESDDQGNHNAKVEWSRSGEAGKGYAFRLPITELGIDQDGDPVTTCTIQPIDSFPRQSKTPRASVGLQALKEILTAHGSLLNGESSVPSGVVACRLDQWKEQWLLRTGYDPGKSADANFWKDKSKLINDGTIRISKPYVWINLI